MAGRLITAAKDGKWEQLEALLKEGEDPNQSDSEFCSPIFCAAEQGNDEAVKALIAKGANVNLPGPGGNTPLHRAAHRGHEPVVRTLVENGANVHAREVNGWTPRTLSKFADESGAIQALLAKHGAEDEPIYKSDWGLSDLLPTVAGLAAGFGFVAINKDKVMQPGGFFYLIGAVVLAVFSASLLRTLFKGP